MMKRIISLLLAVLLLGFAACGQKQSQEPAQPTESEAPAAAAPAASPEPEAGPSVLRTVGGYAVVPNDNDRRVTYPFMLQTENAVWYLAASDMELMGEEAFYAGLEDILQYVEADMADAQQALAGRIPDEIPPVEIRTDFCGKAEISQDAGAYYNGRANFIKLFHSWDMAKFSLLHEYVHYLTVHCAEKKTMHYFYIETVAEYVSKFVCENRMIRSIDFSNSDQPELNALAEIWGDFDQVKYRNACLSESDAFARGLHDERPFSCVGQYTTARKADKRLPDHLHELSYAEADSMALYLIETGGEEKYLDHWDILDEEELAGLYGCTVAELMTAWSTWNAEQCEKLGLN